MKKKFWSIKKIRRTKIKKMGPKKFRGPKNKYNFFKYKMNRFGPGRRVNMRKLSSFYIFYRHDLFVKSGRLINRLYLQCNRMFSIVKSH